MQGLVIDDEESTKFWLSHISYYRLKHYTYTFKDKETGNFIGSTSFEQVLKLCFFDRALRLIIFDAIETIEVAFKTLLSNKMCCKHGTHWYLTKEKFSEYFEYDEFINKVHNDFLEQDEGSVKAYSKTYDDPKLPPSWMVMEFTTFGTMSKMFEHVTDREEKLSICDHFGIPDNVLITWLHSFTHIRNRIAHHSRLVYRSIKEPILPSRKKHKFLNEADNVERSKLYCMLCCMQFLVNKINPNSNFKKALLNLIESYPHLDYSKMGFTENWKQESIWL